MRLWMTLVVTSVVMAAACGEDEPQNVSLEDVSRPWVAWVRGNGLCSKLDVVDADGVWWSDAGCERPITLKKVDTAAADTVEELRTRVEGLSEDSEARGAGCSHEGLRHSFISRRPDADEFRVSACSTASEYDDPTGLPEAFVAVAEAFLMVR